MATQISIIGIGGSLRSSDTEVRQVINKIQLSNTNIEEIVDYDNAQTDSLANSFVILDTTYVGNAKRIPVPGRINLGINTDYIDLYCFMDLCNSQFKLTLLGRYLPE